MQKRGSKKPSFWPKIVSQKKLFNYLFFSPLSSCNLWLCYGFLPPISPLSLPFFLSLSLTLSLPISLSLSFSPSFLSFSQFSPSLFHFSLSLTISLSRSLSFVFSLSLSFVSSLSLSLYLSLSLSLPLSISLSINLSIFPSLILSHFISAFCFFSHFLFPSLTLSQSLFLSPSLSLFLINFLMFSRIFFHSLWLCFIFLWFSVTFTLVLTSLSISHFCSLSFVFCRSLPSSLTSSCKFWN